MSASPVQVRRCGPDDWDALVRLDELSFLYTYDRDRSPDQPEPIEYDRTLLAVLDGEPAGLASAYTLELSVPGGVLPMAGVTWVGVVPTARRRGVLTALMDQQLRDVRSRGEHIAGLYASEPMIYGRFGYGVANRFLTFRVPRGHGAVDGPPADHLRARIVSTPDSRAAVDDVYTRVRAVRAGAPARTDDWWKRTTLDVPGDRGGASELRTLLVEDAHGSALAYAMFDAKEEWEHGYPETPVRVREAMAVDPAAATLLWRTLLGLDLVGRVEVRALPVDDVLLHLLRDTRRARPALRDGLYMRLVDLAGALSSRAYDVPWTGVVEVADAHAPWNAGRWRLVLGPDDLAVERTDADPDVRCDVRELGAAYLGAGSLVARARAGLVEELTPGAVAGLERAMRHDPAPFCPFHF